MSAKRARKRRFIRSPRETGGGHPSARKEDPGARPAPLASFNEPNRHAPEPDHQGASILIGRDDLTAIERGEPPQDDNVGAVPEEVHAAVTEESIDTAGMVGVKRLVVSGLVARGAQDSRI